MVYRRSVRRQRVRRTGGTRRGRRLQQDGQIVVRRARNAALVAAMARYGPAALRGVYNAGREMMRVNRMKAREAKVSSKRMQRTGMMRRRAGMEQSKARASYGRRTVASVGRLMEMAIPSRVLRFQGVKSADDGTGLPGYFRMPLTISGGQTSGGLPLYAICLNGTMQSTTSARPLYRAAIASTGRISWSVENGVLHDNTSTVGWYVEKADTSIADNRYVSPMWYNIRLNMYGAKTQQTSFVVEYIQCMHDYAAIEDEADTLFTQTGVHGEHYKDIVYGYWQNKVRALVTNPISADFANKRTNRFPPYKVLKTWRFDIRPAQTTDVDDSPNNYVFSAFIRDGRLLDYSWIGVTGAFDSTNVSATAGLDDRIVEPNFVVRESGTNPVNNPHPRHRRYLIVRAVNTTRALQGSETVDNTPSFDLVVRKAERFSHNRND